MTGVVIGAFFYFECGQFPRLNSVKGNGDQLLTLAMSELLAMVSILYKTFANKPR